MSMMELQYVRRSLQSTDLSNNLDDNFDYLNDGEKKRLILKNNPFKFSKDDIFQIFVCDNKNVIASGFHFPISLVIDGIEHECITCSTLSVNKNYRNQGIGSRIHKLRMEYSKNGAIFIGSVSQMQYSIMQKLGAKIFFSPRLILLRNSRPVVDMFIKGIFSKIFTFICNIFILLQHVFIKFIALLNDKYKYRIVEIKDVDNDYENVWKCNKDRFKENHKQEWIKWILESNKHCKLFYIKKNNKVLGWFVLKDQFHEQASQRGFKNVALRSIIEWESTDVKELSYFKICLFAMTMSGDFDAIEFVPFNKTLSNKMRFIGAVPMGKGNVVLRLSDNSPLRGIEGIFEEKNWRLRPAAGDNMLF